MEVHEAGGGINYTVEHTKKASEEELYTLLADRLRRMIKSGKLKLNMKNLCAKTHQITKPFTVQSLLSKHKSQQKDETIDLFLRRQMVLLILHLQ